MAAKLLSFYLLAVAGLGVIRAVPLISDQRRDNSNATVGQQPSNQSCSVNVTSVAVKRAVPLPPFDTIQDPNGSQGAQSGTATSTTSADDPNNTQGQGPGPITLTSTAFSTTTINAVATNVAI